MNFLSKENQERYQETQKRVLNLDWSSPAIYQQWVAQTYHFVSYSTRIISTAGAKFSLDRNEMHLRFLEHAKEEQNHELILLTDLKRMNAKISDFPVSPMTQAFFQTQYYWINEVDPISVYGYFILLESLAVDCGPQVLKTVEAHFPKNACSFLKVHVEEDVDHMDAHESFFQMLTPKDFELTQKNFEVSNALYLGLIQWIEQTVKEKKMNLRAG